MYGIDPDRARVVLRRLREAAEGEGIFGIKKDMPEDLLPIGVVRGSPEHLLFVLLVVALDYMRAAEPLWRAARTAFVSPTTNYLFIPKAVVSVARNEPGKILKDMMDIGLSRKFVKDARYWTTICTTLVDHFDGNVANLLAQAHWDAPELLKLIRDKQYPFPNLRGDKIGPLLVRIFKDACLVELSRLEEVDIPMDVHVIRASLQTGSVLPEESGGTLAQLRPAIQGVWRQACAREGIYPVDLDTDLWNLSRWGCGNTPEIWPCKHQASCPVGDLCQPSRIRVTVNGQVSMNQGKRNIDREEVPRTLWNMDLEYSG